VLDIFEILKKPADTEIPMPQDLNQLPEAVHFIILDYLDITNAYALGSVVLNNYCGHEELTKLTRFACDIALSKILRMDSTIQNQLISVLSDMVEEYGEAQQIERERIISNKNRNSILGLIGGTILFAGGIYSFYELGQVDPNDNGLKIVGLFYGGFVGVAMGCNACWIPACSKYPKRLTEENIQNLPFSILPPVSETIENSKLLNDILKLLQTDKMKIN